MLVLFTTVCFCTFFLYNIQYILSCSKFVYKPGLNNDYITYSNIGDDRLLQISVCVNKNKYILLNFFSVYFNLLSY